MLTFTCVRRDCLQHLCADLGEICGRNGDVPWNQTATAYCTMCTRERQSGRRKVRSFDFALQTCAREWMRCREKSVSEMSICWCLIDNLRPQSTNAETSLSSLPRIFGVLVPVTSSHGYRRQVLRHIHHSSGVKWSVAIPTLPVLSIASDSDQSSQKGLTTYHHRATLELCCSVSGLSKCCSEIKLVRTTKGSSRGVRGIASERQSNFEPQMQCGSLCSNSSGRNE